MVEHVFIISNNWFAHSTRLLFCWNARSDLLKLIQLKLIFENNLVFFLWKIFCPLKKHDVKFIKDFEIFFSVSQNTINCKCSSISSVHQVPSNFFLNSKFDEISVWYFLPRNGRRLRRVNMYHNWRVIMYLWRIFLMYHKSQLHVH